MLLSFGSCCSNNTSSCSTVKCFCVFSEEMLPPCGETYSWLLKERSASWLMEVEEEEEEFQAPPSGVADLVWLRETNKRERRRVSLFHRQASAAAAVCDRLDFSFASSLSVRFSCWIQIWRPFVGRSGWLLFGNFVVVCRLGTYRSIWTNLSGVMSRLSEGFVPSPHGSCRND